MENQEFEITEMSKEQSKLSVEVFGPSGSGKTTALFKIAMGIRDKLYPNEKLKDICLFVDTENGSSSKAVGRSIGGEILEAMQLYKFEPPYDIVKLINLIQFAENKGFKIMIIDSYTAFWSGKDGILDRAAELDVELGNQKKMYGAWSEKEIISKKNLLKLAPISSKMHMLLGMRAKTEYVIELNKYGKQAPRAVGLKEDMQGDIRYEADVVLSLDLEEHTAKIVKDRIGFDEMRKVTKPDTEITTEDGRMLAEIVSQGISQEDILKRKCKYMIDYILKEKSAKSSKVSTLEQSLGTELTNEVLLKLDVTKLLKIYEYVK